MLPGPLPFRDGAFDVVVTLETIEHVLDPDALLAEAHRLLAPGGTLILSTPRLDSFLVIGSLLLGVQPPGVECSTRRRYGSPFGEQRASGHVHLFTRRALAEALAANGFRLDAYGEGRFSSSWWQAVRSDRRPRLLDLALRAGFSMYDLVPFRKDVMVVRATRTGTP
jgi:SAM-dependent methyltransferase